MTKLKKFWDFWGGGIEGEAVNGGAELGGKTVWYGGDVTIRGEFSMCFGEKHIHVILYGYIQLIL